MLAADAHFEAHFDCDAALARRRRDLGEGACWSAFVPAAGRSPLSVPAPPDTNMGLVTAEGRDQPSRHPPRHMNQTVESALHAT